MISNFDPNIKVTFTPSAINKISELTEKEEYIRMYVMGGGCSGFQYMFDIVKEKDEDDIFIADVNVLIDPLSYQYIENSELDNRMSVVLKQLQAEKNDILKLKMKYS